MTAHAQQQVDIAIVGAGMVGLALAAALADCDVSILLIDAAEAPAQTEPLTRAQNREQGRLPPPSATQVQDFSSRVSALTGQTRQQLMAYGAWPLLAEHVQPYQKMHVWDALGTEAITFEASELPADSLGCIVENRRVIAALHQRVLQQENASVWWRARLAKMEELAMSDTVSAASPSRYRLQTEDGREVCANLVVGADGALSRVRQWAGFPTREWDYQHSAIVCTVKTSSTHGDTAWQRFDENGPLAFLPLRDAARSGYFSSVVWSQKTAVAEALMQRDEADFAQALEAAIESRLGKVEAVSQRQCFPLRQRHAKSYVRDGIVLLGDAAHTIHPLAGQGVNLGFKDVAALAREIRRAREQGLAVCPPQYLARYQRERQADNLLMMGVMEGFKRLFEQDDPVVRLLRNTGLGLLNRQSSLKNLLARQAMGV